ncbi:MAG: hypothetical protein WD688_12185 [Candidatus Binatia bacterium]
MVRHEVTDRGARTLKFRVSREVNDQDVQFVVIGTCVSTKSFISLNVFPESVFNVLAVPYGRFLFVDPIKQITAEFKILAFIKRAGEGLLDKRGGLIPVHFVSTR